jgi:hypothetical protein|tara:strand:+ start:468 stop:662 length:195 start_codon:yes stop_codon:yes gene_type:complete
MSKVKDWLWDTAEQYLEELINDVKSKKLTIAQACDVAREQTIAWDLVGINDESELKEVLEQETA